MNKSIINGVGLLLCAVLAGVARAGDIADDIRADEKSPNGKNGGFLELGIRASLYNDAYEKLDPSENDDLTLEFGLSISAGYRYKRVFVEASESGFDGLNFGVTLLENDRWSVDFLLANVAGTIDIDTDTADAEPETEQEKNRALVDRASLYVAAGSRVTGYFGDNIVQFRLVSDWYDFNGMQASARLGRQWQRGNWNFQAVAGLRFFSQRFNNYLIGVTEAEASQRFTQFTAGSAWIPEFEVGASKPLSKNWIYSARLRSRYFPDSVTDSPLIGNSGDTLLTTGIHYVF